jgi:hypothetical protein
MQELPQELPQLVQELINDVYSKVKATRVRHCSETFKGASAGGRDSSIQW